MKVIVDNREHPQLPSERIETDNNLFIKEKEGFFYIYIGDEYNNKLVQVISKVGLKSITLK